MKEQEELWKEFKEALKDGNFAIISASTKDTVGKKKEFKQTANLALDILLKDYVDITLAYGRYKYEDGTPAKELSYVVYGTHKEIEESDIKELAKKYNQESYICNNELKYTDGSTKNNIKFKKVVFGKEAKKQEFYTEIIEIDGKEDEKYFALI